MRALLSVDDLADDDISTVLARAAELAVGAEPAAAGRAPLVALIFLETSLRTRVGFAAAAARLGWPALDVERLRSGPTSMPERWSDTLRVVAGYADIVVTRPAAALDRAQLPVAGARLVNAGDAGPRAEHPTQALVDRFAIEAFAGPVHEMRIAVCGDLRMRAVRSLFRLLARTPPRRLVLTTAAGLMDDKSLDGLRHLVEIRPPWHLDDIDVLYVAGMPHGVLPLDERERLVVDSRALGSLPHHGVVLSPLPLLDEMADDARSDPRVRMFEQSDRALYVRMAVLEALAGDLRSR